MTTKYNEKIKDELYFFDAIEKLVNDLYGDYDRLSSGGKEKLDKLANLVLPKKEINEVRKGISNG